MLVDGRHHADAVDGRDPARPRAEEGDQLGGGLPPPERLGRPATAWRGPRAPPGPRRATPSRPAHGAIRRRAAAASPSDTSHAARWAWMNRTGASPDIAALRRQRLSRGRGPGARRAGRRRPASRGRAHRARPARPAPGRGPSSSRPGRSPRRSPRRGAARTTDGSPAVYRHDRRRHDRGERLQRVSAPNAPGRSARDEARRGEPLEAEQAQLGSAGPSGPRRGSPPRRRPWRPGRRGRQDEEAVAERADQGLGVAGGPGPADDVVAEGDRLLEALGQRHRHDRPTTPQRDAQGRLDIVHLRRAERRPPPPVAPPGRGRGRRGCGGGGPRSPLPR